LAEPSFLIANPAAGSGRAARVLPGVVAVLSEHGADPCVHQTSGAGDARRMAASLPDGASVAVLGGDGTLNEVLNGLAGKDCPILLLPAGTGNDLARTMGMVRDPVAAARALERRIATIDLGEIDGHLFANNAGVGLDGEVCRLIQNCDRAFQGRLGYVRAFISCAFNLRATPLHLEHDGVSQSHLSLLLTFANGQFYGRGMRIAPSAILDDGLLDLCLLLDVDRFSLLRCFPRVYNGSHVQHPAFRLWRAHSIRLYGERPLAMHADGEVIGRLSTDAAAPTVVRIAAARQRFVVPA
jgi:diacylglycerol kinase (ATP)